MAMPTSYLYQPLTSTRSTRLIHIEPQSTSLELRVNLEQFCLDDATLPPYSALSYCWEGQTMDYPVLCNGATLNVTKNCWEAMMKLRMPEKAALIWIDGICIDQANVEEKSCQVQLMAEIYKNAEKVVVWLGTWSAKMQQAVDVVKNLGDMSSLGMDSTHDDGVLCQQQKQHRVGELMATTKHPSDDVLGALFHRPWFDRMWTIQEVAVARGDNVFIYNGPDPAEQLPWTTMISAIDALMVCGYPWVDLSRTVKLHKQLILMIIMERWPAMKGVYAMKPGNWQNTPMVWPVMCDSREKAATDAKDKVFALYGVFKELNIARTLPAPDYSKTAEDIYRELTIACIESDKSLRVLFDAPSDRRHLRRHLPSWVPDWSDSGWRGKGDADCRLAFTNGPFCAGDIAQPAWSFSEDGHRLQLRGKFVDDVFVCSRPFCVATDEHALADIKDSRDSMVTSGVKEIYLDELCTVYDALKSWASVHAWYDIYPATAERPSEAFCRTLMQDTDDPNAEPDTTRRAFTTAWFNIMTSASPDVEVFRAGFQALVADLAALDDAAIEHVIRESPPAAVPRGALKMKPGGKFHSRAMVFSNRRGFFITSGGLMGTAPARAELLGDGRSKAVNLVEAGDRIAVVQGLEMPMILRPLKQQGADVDAGHEEAVYALITHAYVHGIMYGEAWEDEFRDIEEITLV